MYTIANYRAVYNKSNMTKKKGSWTILESKTVYKNPWIKVIEDKVIQPDNKEGIFAMVEMKSGVSVVPLDEKGNVYLTKEYHYAIAKETIEAISGGIDKGETKLVAAKRELQEEAGIIAAEWIDMGFVVPFTSVINSTNYMYMARNLQFVKRSLEGTEEIEIIKMPLQEAVQLVKESKIIHGATVILILKMKNYLQM